MPFLAEVVKADLLKAGYVDEAINFDLFLICRRQSWECEHEAECRRNELGVYGWTYLRLVDGEEAAMRDIRRIAAGAPPGSSVKLKGK
jgi:hypothetical protein